MTNVEITERGKLAIVKELLSDYAQHTSGKRDSARHPRKETYRKLNIYRPWKQLDE